MIFAAVLYAEYAPCHPATRITGPGFYLLAIYGGDTTTVPTIRVITPARPPQPVKCNCHISEARIPGLVPAKQSSEADPLSEARVCNQAV